jgi:predicted DsbA family dithiol-disulfide isomerase
VSAIPVVHFSDLLCVWAYVANRRMDELHDEFGEAVDVSYRFVSVFGAARAKLDARWRDKGGLAAYAEHVRGIASEFGHVAVHRDVWASIAPMSSTPAHLAIAAVRLATASGAAPPRAAESFAWRLREAFFRDAEDIGREDVVLSVVDRAGLDRRAVSTLLASGEAHAAFAADADAAREWDVRMSPTLILDGGRQRLHGNVGYRVIAANVRELLEKKPGQASWC